MTTAKPATKNTDLAAIARLTFQPELSVEQFRQSESEYNRTWGVQRRMMLLTLTRTKDELAQGFRDAADAGEFVAQMLEDLEAYKQHMRDGLNLTESAISRILIAASAAAIDPVEGGAA